MASAAYAQMLISLVAVVGLIFACAWVFKRMPLSGAGKSSLLQVKASLAVGARERVVLLQAGDQHLVLGVAPGRVQTLHVLEGELTSSAEFSQLMQQESDT